MTRMRCTGRSGSGSESKENDCETLEGGSHRWHENAHNRAPSLDYFRVSCPPGEIHWPGSMIRPADKLRIAMFQGCAPLIAAEMTTRSPRRHAPEWPAEA